MSVSAIFGARLVMPPQSLPFPASSPSSATLPALWNGRVGGGSAAMIECSSRPNKKATAHHMKTRPRKTQPWDIKRKPTVYPPLPPLPPDWTLVESAPPPPPEPSVAG